MPIPSVVFIRESSCFFRLGFTGAVRWVPHFAGVLSTHPPHLCGPWQHNQHPRTAPLRLSGPQHSAPALLFSPSTAHSSLAHSRIWRLSQRALRFYLPASCGLFVPLNPIITGAFQGIPCNWPFQAYIHSIGAQRWGTVISPALSCTSSILPRVPLRATCFDGWDQNAILGRKVVTSFSRENLSCLPRPTLYPGPWLSQRSLNSKNADEAGAFLLGLWAPLLPLLQSIRQLCPFILLDLPWTLSYQVWLPCCFLAFPPPLTPSSSGLLHLPPSSLLRLRGFFLTKEQSVITMCSIQYEIFQ